MVLVLCEMRSVRSRIWTCVAVSISCDDSHFTTGTYQFIIITSLRSLNAVLPRAMTHRMWRKVNFYEVYVFIQISAVRVSCDTRSVLRCLSVYCTGWVWHKVNFSEVYVFNQTPTAWAGCDTRSVFKRFIYSSKLLLHKLGVTQGQFFGGMTKIGLAYRLKLTLISSMWTLNAVWRTHHELLPIRTYDKRE